MAESLVRGRRRLAAGPLVCLAFIAAACGSTINTPDDAAQPTIAGLPEISLIPAEDATTPEQIPSVETLPSIPPPSGTPASPPVVQVDYTFGADDLDAFAEAYQAAFSVELDHEVLDGIGARLCTYLMRHADGTEVVSLDRALIEADLNEPGYSPGDWLAALRVANDYYCGEFIVDFASFGG